MVKGGLRLIMGMREMSMRDEFEAWYIQHMADNNMIPETPKSMKEMRDGEDYGRRGYLNGCWDGYKAARAQPAQQVCDECMAINKSNGLSELREHLERILKLHEEKGVVLTADIEHLRELLSATSQPEGQQGSVPEWMSEISENLKTQDNRMTADPMFVVFQKDDIVVDEDYDHDVIVWVDDEGNKADPETVDQLNDMRADMVGVYYMENEIELGDEERQEWRRFAIKETDKFVTACFTEAGAKAYLNRDGHNLKKPFIYATSLYRNEEMKRLRDWLMFAAPQPEGEVPEGWKLVPVEPTPDMRRAFHDAHERFEDGEEVDGSPDDEWRAMLDAAPQPPQEGSGNE